MVTTMWAVEVDYDVTLANMVTTMWAVGRGYHMKVWLGKVFSPGHRQLMCCALKSTGREGKVRRRRVRRCKKELQLAK